MLWNNLEVEYLRIGIKQSTKGVTMKKNVIVLFIIMVLGMTAWRTNAQHGDQQRYYWPEDPLVLEKLAWWQDLKFGLLMHWGPYSQWGVVESWSLCPEDEDWCVRRGPYSHDYYEYRNAYENLQQTFNPEKFNPQKWADAAEKAGMKYMVFTTKHHDGFSMFDTQLTDYKITSEKCPFSGNPKSNITNEVFKAFREKGMGIGAYFSKPDWHCPDYWDPYFPPIDRNVNYDIKKYPEKWQRYKDFTWGQISELLTGYGKVDILWLDGGWVEKGRDTVYGNGKRIVNQDIDMSGLAAMARTLQPGILVVDRAVEGPNQNYLTPEQRVPEKLLNFPWETCMTMGNSWSYVPGDFYKSSDELIRLLCRIVARGGNFLLNIGPGPDGDWDPAAYSRLEEIGAWMKVNGEGIYASKPSVPYEKDGFVYTQNGDYLYAIYLTDHSTVPASLKVSLPEGYGRKPVVLGWKGSAAGSVKAGELIIPVTGKLRKAMESTPALVFRFKKD